MGRASTFPSITVGLILVAWMPRIADCGGLMMGVPNSDPNTPPLEIVNVPDDDGDEKKGDELNH